MQMEKIENLPLYNTVCQQFSKEDTRDRDAIEYIDEALSIVVNNQILSAVDGLAESRGEDDKKILYRMHAIFKGAWKHLFEIIYRPLVPYRFNMPVCMHAINDGQSMASRYVKYMREFIHDDLVININFSLFFVSNFVQGLVFGAFHEAQKKI